jgi:Dolichyl-phosphate-mannose-protein mannosyltransferase
MDEHPIDRLDRQVAMRVGAAVVSGGRITSGSADEDIGSHNLQHAACCLLARMELSKSVATSLWRVQKTAHRAVATTLNGPWQNRRKTWLIAILIAVLHAAMAVTAVNTKSPTFDEPQHLTAGYSYWVTNDFRLDPENGSLPARWAALPLLFGRPNFVPLADRGWQSADEGGTAHQFLYEVGNDPDRMLTHARIMMSMFGAALCLLIYRCSREFFGISGGLLAETVAAFDPNLLANSALVASDIPATFFFTATIWSCWRLSQKISPATLTVAALSLSGLFLTKFSAPIVLPVLATMSIWQIFSRREIKLSFGQFQNSLAKEWKKACVIGASSIFLSAIVVFAIWLSFSFRYSAWIDNRSNDNRTTWHWSYLVEDGGTFESAVSFARAHHLLPEAYLYGLAYVHKHEDDRRAFLDNQWSLVGFRSFFPRAFIYKTPLPLLCLLVLAFYAALARRDSWRGANLNPFGLFVLVFAAFAIRAQLNIGYRHILPIYPALFVGCGAVICLVRKHGNVFFAPVIGLLLLWQMGESIAVRPNYLAYFNEIAGGPSCGYEHLVDSSLDWGQDLPSLRRWIDHHAEIVVGKPRYLAYFGSADPRRYGIDAKRLPEDHTSGDRSFAPLGGGIYCVSATTLQSVYAREIGPWSLVYERQYQTALSEIERYRITASDPSARIALIANEGAVSWAKKIHIFERLRFERLCAFLRHRSPEAEIGYSIFVFDLSGEEVNRALYGPPAELTREVSVAGY